METDQAENPEQVLLRMAAGDCSALLFFSNILMQPSAKIPLREALVAAECFASLAAATGSLKAKSVLAAVKLCQANEMKGDEPERAEGIWWVAADLMFELAKEGGEAAAASLIQGLSERADAGDEDAAVLLNDVITALPPAALDAARAFGEQAQFAPVGGDNQSAYPLNGLGAGGPTSIAEILALASLASGGGANAPLPVNPTAGGQNLPMASSSGGPARPAERQAAREALGFAHGEDGAEVPIPPPPTGFAPVGAR